MFANVIVLVAVVVIAVAPLAMFMSFCDWAHDNHRVPFFVKWWTKKSRNKARRNIFEARVAARRN